MPWRIDRLGELAFDSPLNLSFETGDFIANFVPDESRILVDHCLDHVLALAKEGKVPDYFEVAGPRSKTFFRAGSVKAAIVTCGGLCPGLNDVIRSLVMQLYYYYDVKEILGIKYGFRGMTVEHGGTAIPLTPDVVDNIHTFGGSFLGSSRGPQSFVEMVDFLQYRDTRILFVIGGDGSIRGANSIYMESKKRGYTLSVVGIPKTIDNDIAYIDQSFGFSTAVEKATEVLACAHVEARGAINGIGLVKLMGRNSGFIASRSTLASGFVNFVMVPEVPFDLQGENGFLVTLRKRLERRGHAVIVVAEGAGQQHLINDQQDHDKSGNKRLGDIGLYLKQVISDYLKSQEIEYTLKYIDPSYTIRSAPANTDDNVFCTELAQNAVHAAFAGRTNMIVGSRHNEFVMIPMDLAVSRRKTINPDGPEWLAVMQSTGQPPRMVGSETGE